MKKIFKTLGTLFSSNKTASTLPAKPEKTLEEAVREDDVQGAYDLLSRGADVNIKITQEKERYVTGHDIEKVTCQTCLLSIATSEPMKRLLLHFGALSLDKLEQRWAKEAAKKEAEEEAERKHREEEKERKLAEKAAADNHFLDDVLR